jgi:CHAT domain
MGTLADVIAEVPGDYRRLGPIAAVAAQQRFAALEAEAWPPEQRAWRLWLEAHWAKNAAAFAIAHEALDAAERVAGGTSYLLALEIAGLRGKLFQDDGEAGRAYPQLTWAMRGWLELGGAFTHPTAVVAAALRGARDLVVVALGAEYVAGLARGAGMRVDESAAALWLERMVTETAEVVTRAVSLTAQVEGFAAARGLANDALAATRSWQIPGWRPLRFEVGLRLTLSSSADDLRNYAAALGQSEDGLALAGRLPPGRERDTLTARLHANRARALLGLGRATEAVDEYDVALEGLHAAGATADAAVIALSPMIARAGAGEPVSTAELTRAIATMEAQAALLEGGDGRLMAMIEYARRLLLSQMAREGADDLEAVIGLIEVLRDDRPLIRRLMTDDDPVLARVSRPFAILGERLRRLPGTVLVVIEPQIEGPGHTPVFLTVSANGWHLAVSETAHEALYGLVRQADAERETLLTGEIAPRTPPSVALIEAAEAGWRALPAEVREAIRAAHTVIYLPSGGASVADIPFELLRHEDGWLGVSHVVARCPSIQYLEEALAPNARRPAADPRFAVASAVDPSPGLVVLGEADAEMELVTRAAGLLGLSPEPLLLDEPRAALDAFTHRAVVHYVGHGFANPIGELLPLSGGAVLNASELSEGDGDRAPFVFFNACLLGRVRHIAGGRQRGWALRLLDRGAPAVVGALATVPDSVCVPVARAFYTAARTAAAGEAMRQARARLDGGGMHPLVWAAYVLHGDPFAGIAAQAPGSAADMVRDWAAEATRLVATGRDVDERQGAEEDDLAAAVDVRLERDPEGAAAYRILLALARLRRNPDDRGEASVAYLCADALHDGYAILHLYGTYGETLLRNRPAGARDVMTSSARWWLARLSGDRAAVAHLLRGYAAIEVEDAQAMPNPREGGSSP